MEMIPVESSNLEAVHYDEPTQTLVVRFHSGRVYSYADVPRAVMDGLRAAPSKGAYLNSAIKPRYTATKQPAVPEQPATERGVRAISVAEFSAWLAAQDDVRVQILHDEDGRLTWVPADEGDWARWIARFLTDDPRRR